MIADIHMYIEQFSVSLEDENFAVPHNKRGIVGMANKGRHTNGSQFYITLQECNWMNSKYVAFGYVRLSFGRDTSRRDILSDAYARSEIP